MKLHNTIYIGILMLATMACKDKQTEVVEEHHEESAMVELTAEQFKTADIRFGNISERTLSGTIKVNGVLDVPPQNLVTISAPYGGFLKNTEMLQGMRVKKGQAIATIEHPDYIQLQQDYLENKSQLEYLQEEYERQKSLADENVSSKKSYQNAKAQYESTRARVMGLKAKLEMIHINVSELESGKIRSTVSLTSPINGYVTEVRVNIGAYVNATDVLFKIVDTDHLHAELTVFEKDITKIALGQKVRFKLANESTERMATIYLIGREISPDRTVRVHCHLDKEDRELIPGLYLTAWIETAIHKVQALPEKAIVDYEGKKYIFIETEEAEEGKEKEEEKEEPYHFKMIEVQAGVNEYGYTEVILPEGTDGKSWKVVTEGAYDLLSKMKNNEEDGQGHAH